MKKDYKLILVLIAAFLIVIGIQRLYYSPEASKNRALKNVEKTNLSVPEMIDAETVLDSISVINDKTEIVL